MGVPCRRVPAVCKRPGREDLAADPVMGDDDMWISLPYLQTRYERRYRRSDHDGCGSQLGQLELVLKGGNGHDRPGRPVALCARLLLGSTRPLETVARVVSRWFTRFVEPRSSIMRLCVLCLPTENPPFPRPGGTRGQTQAQAH